MPRRPRSACTIPGCPELVDEAGRCPVHRRELDRDIKARQTYRRYGTRWSRIQARVIKEEPRCQCADDCPWHRGRVCGAPTDDVDHRIPLRAGGTHTRANLQGLCRHCHNRKTAAETRGGGDPSVR